MRTQTQPPIRYAFSRWLWLRGLACIYLIAFLSLWAQVDGLFGSHGISSIQELVTRLALQKKLGFWDAPSLFWWSSSDATLHWACGFGVFFSLLSMAGVLAPVAFISSWFLYLSFVSLGGVFFGYQWDALLLEAGFLAIFTAPWRLFSRPSQETEPHRAILLVWWALLFKLMFLSGVVKLASGDKTWRDLSALGYHYYTQPLPSWVAYYVYQLPSVVHSFSVLVTFVIELFFPFLIFASRRTRYVAAAAFLLLQSMIVLTGRYGFFNLLTCVLCVPLLDDALLQRFIPKRWEGLVTLGEERRPSRAVASIVCGVAAIILVLSSLQVFGRSLGFDSLPSSGKTLLKAVDSFSVVNSYGLFAVMTTKRDEIELEGSIDNKTWEAYQFTWKPDLLDEAPSFATPHQPRLDWQMWFASLGSCSRNQWFLQLQQRLLEGSPAVEALLEKNPFPEKPPLYIRSTVYRYEFTALGESQNYWKRTKIKEYCPELTLFEGKLDTVANF